MSERVPIADPDVSPVARKRVERIMEEGRLAAGEEVRAFESAFADACECDHAVATSNGTTALHAALEGLGIGEGDRVVTTPFSFVATANAVRLAGADPVFADVDPETYALDPASVWSVVESVDVDALLVVHLYGHPAPMDRLDAIASAHDLAVVEDAAQAHGAAIDGRPVGSFSDAACFSFYPTKNMTTGEGGMVVTDDPDVAERTRRFVDHGRTGRYEHATVGHNFRLTNLAAAIGLEQLQRLRGFVEVRRSNAATLDDLLAGTDLALPVETPRATHAYHQYTVRTADRDELAAHLDDAGVDTGVYYPRPIHRQPAYDDVDSRHPVAERLADEVLSLPVHPGLSPDDLRRIGAAVTEFDPAPPATGRPAPGRNRRA